MDVAPDPLHPAHRPSGTNKFKSNIPQPHQMICICMFIATKVYP